MQPVSSVTVGYAHETRRLSSGYVPIRHDRDAIPIGARRSVQNQARSVHRKRADRLDCTFEGGKSIPRLAVEVEAVVHELNDKGTLGRRNTQRGAEKRKHERREEGVGARLSVSGKR